MIIYNGIIKKGKVDYIVFKNDQGHSVDVPIDMLSAKRIAMYLDKISPNNFKIIAHDNDEPGD